MKTGYRVSERGYPDAVSNDGLKRDRQRPGAPDFQSVGQDRFRGHPILEGATGGLEAKPPALSAGWGFHPPAMSRGTRAALWVSPNSP
jgi:hypothetical protein